MRTSETRGNIKREARSRSLVFNVAGVFSLTPMKLKTEKAKSFSWEQVMPRYNGNQWLENTYFQMNSFKMEVQLRAKRTAPLVNKHYQNEVTLTGQSPPLKCCQPLESLAHLITGLDLSLPEIWSLQVKGLQSCRPSKFQNFESW